MNKRINEYLLSLEDKGIIINPVISAYRGSIAHNMYMPNTDPNSIDDIDLIVVCIPDVRYYLGLKTFGSRGTVEVKDNELDIVIYEFKKTIQMLINSNPNILSLLWLKEEHYFTLGNYQVGEMLIKNRDLFSSKNIYYSFVGYAAAQMEKMQKYSTLGYMGKKRKRLVDKFGYDCKNAAHTIRLLKMCIEFLSTGKLNVYRDQDREQLLDIKTGKLTLDQVKNYARNLFSDAENAFYKSELKDKPDENKIEELMISCIEAAHEQ